MAIVVEACVLDSSQKDSLLMARNLGIAAEIVLVCAEAGDDGGVRLWGGVSREGLDGQVAELRAQGYQVRLALTFGGGPGVAIDPAHATKLLEQPSFRARAIEQLGEIDADGYELAFPQLMNASRTDLIAFVAGLSVSTRPARTLGIFAPPSASLPSDLPGGDAYDLPALRPYVDRFRLMTLDFSCCGAGPGPTLDSLWAASVASVAIGQVPEGMVDLAIPLYGVHFWPGRQQYVSYTSAMAISAQHQAAIHRSADNVPHFQFPEAGQVHEVWFDDQASILSYLAAWKPPTVPASVGVVLYGVGDEDPALWPSLGEVRP